TTVVIVAEAQELAACFVHAEIVITVQPDVSRLPDVANSRIRGCRLAAQRLGLVSGRVIADEDFEVRIILAADVRKARTQHRCAVARRYPEGDERRRHATVFLPARARLPAPAAHRRSL